MDQPSQTPAPERKVRVLIVDDEVSFTRMVKLNLEKTGRYDVRELNVATFAVTTAREFKPDLIFLDVIMPGQDGGDVAAQLQRDRYVRGTPVVFLTATVSRREAGTEGLNSGGALFLAKPVSVGDLIACIDQHSRKADSEPLAP